MLHKLNNLISTNIIFKITYNFTYDQRSDNLEKTGTKNLLPYTKKRLVEHILSLCGWLPIATKKQKTNLIAFTNNKNMFENAESIKATALV